MDTVVNVAEIVGGFGIIVAIMYAIWQVNEARRGREAVYFVYAFSQSPTEITIEMETVRKGIKEGTLTYSAFMKLPEDQRGRLLSPLNMFDVMGWMVSMGTVRLKSVTSYVGEEVILKSWRAYEPFVKELRDNMGDYCFYYFEDLINRINR